jgi:ribonuclease HI
MDSTIAITTLGRLTNRRLKERMKIVTLTTSSAIRGDRAGWGYVLRCGNDSREDAGGENVGDMLRYRIRSPEDTVSRVFTVLRRMELLAIIKGLQRLKLPCEVLLRSEDLSLLDDVCIERFRWKEAGWTRTWKKYTFPIKSADLWKRLDIAAEKHSIVTEEVDEQSGGPDREHCDDLARIQASRFATGLEAVSFFRDVLDEVLRSEVRRSQVKR